MTTSCPDEGTILQFLEGRLPPLLSQELEEHVDACVSCRKLIASAARTAAVTRAPPAAEEIAAPGTPPAAGGVLAPGTNVGRYLVLHLLGAGGMGVVYAAYDPELDRKVALKLLRPDAGGAGARARLLREAQAMARLAHPNVIAVHDVGTYGDQVFVAMEFVEGATLRGWLEEAPRLWREILRVFVLAGRGLAAAHAAGLVHRDFKPDNVLIGRDGRPRVLDFGLVGEGTAEQDGHDGASGSAPPPLGAPLTEAGALMGTPGYMAPEQYLRRPADARTDQFSFCVALYEALYRARPFPGNTPLELARAAVEGRVVEPAADARVPGWVRRIVLRGLRPGPSERYPTMEALLADLSRDPTALRRRLILAGAVVALVGAAVVVTRELREDRDLLCRGAERKLEGTWDEERKRAVRTSLLATGKAYSRSVWTAVERALDGYGRGWAAMHREACEATRVRGEQSEELLDLRMLCLDRRLKEARALTALLAAADDKIVRQAVKAVGGLPDLAQCASAAELLARDRPPADPALRTRGEEVRARIAEAGALHLAGKLREALRVAEEASARADALPDRPLRAAALYRLGALLGRLGKDGEAEEALLRAWRAALAGRDDRLAARAASRLVWLLGYRRARYAEARAWGQSAGGLIERLGDEGRLQAELSAALGLVHGAEGKHHEALQEQRRALALAEKTLGAGHPELPMRSNNVGLALYRLGRHDEALTYYRRALATGEAAYGREHPDIAVFLNNIGIIASERGRYDEAIAHFRRVLDLYERGIGTRHPGIAQAHNNLGLAHQGQGRSADALAHFRRALALREEVSGRDHPSAAIVLNNIGYLLATTGRSREAMPPLERALAIWEKRHGREHPDVALATQNLGWALLAQGEREEAMRRFRAALAIGERALGPAHHDVGESLLGIGETFLAMRSPAAAVAPLRRAVAIFEAHRIRPLLRGRARFALARALWRSTPREETRELLRQARDDFAGAGPVAKRERAAVEAWLVR
ncbi:MAG TPA: tetratricopeptide repeat protein [Dehalococcoidia bacterium]|nr:tetratricopeptide repeat protein [Dehalococcoidia bacterium]